MLNKLLNTPLSDLASMLLKLAIRFLLAACIVGLVFSIVYVLFGSIVIYLTIGGGLLYLITRYYDGVKG